MADDWENSWWQEFEEMRCDEIMSNRFSSLFSYAEYEYKLANEYVIPLLKYWNIRLRNMKLLDIGCGPGGTTVAFAEHGCNCVGIDISERAIKSAAEFAKKRDVTVAFFKEDICNPKILKEDEFDITILRDVIEHVYDPKSALTDMFRLLKEKGLAYVSFPPYYSPFGGHQHDPSAITRLMPYVHLLPRHVYFRLLPKKESYRKLVKTVRENKMSIFKFEKLVDFSNFKILRKESHLMRPSHRSRYGVSAVETGIMSRIPFVREFITSGCTYLLMKTDAK